MAAGPAAAAGAVGDKIKAFSNAAQSSGKILRVGSNCLVA